MTVTVEEHAARAQRLHQESFVFDYFPRGEPMVLSASEEAAMHRALGDGVPAGGVLNVIREQRTRDIATDPAAAQRIRDLWQQAGVKAVTCTLGGLDGRVDDHEAVVRDVARWQSRFRVGDYLVNCRSADDFDRAFQAGRWVCSSTCRTPHTSGRTSTTWTCCTDSACE